MRENKGRLDNTIAVLRQSWDKINERRKTYYLYTLLFLIIFLISFSPFLTGKKSFICQFDGREIYFQEIIYSGKWMREIVHNFAHGSFSIPLYDFSKGWGSRIIEHAIDPLILVTAPFFSAENAEILYSFLIILRLYFAGLAYLYMCRYFRKEKLTTLAGCFVYLFSAYTIYAGLAFPGFITPMIQLPLLITGAEKVMRKERSIGLVFTVFFTSVCGAYHLFMHMILIGLYCIIRLFSLYPRGKRLKVLPGILGRGIGKWLLGLGMSTFIMLPAIQSFGSAGRSGFSNVSISNSLAVHWRYFWVRLTSLISPIQHYDWDWGLDYPAYAAIFLLCAVMVYTAGRKKKVSQKWLLGIGLFMLFCPWCGLVMNGFQYPCNRWSFGLALLAGFLVTDTIPNLFHMTSVQKKVSVAAVVVYGCIAFLSAEIRKEVFASVGTAFLAATLMLVLLCDSEPERAKRIKTALCLGLVCLNICSNALYLNSSESMGWSEWFSPAGYETANIISSVESEPAYSPYGYTVEDGRIDSTFLQYNNAAVYGYPGTSIYTSYLNGNIVEFRDATEESGNVQYFKIYSSDQRTILNTLLSVDQQYERTETVQYVPYGYSYCGNTLLGSRVYQNDYSLGWGYTYDHSVSYDEVEDLNGVDMQELMLRSVVLDSDKQIESAPVITENERVPYTYQCSGCVWKDGIISVEDGGGRIHLTADLHGGKEYYIRIKGFAIDGYGDDNLTISTNASFNIVVESGGVVKYGRAMDQSYPWYYGRENYLFCLGYMEEDRNIVQVRIPGSGTFRLDDIELYGLSMDRYPEQIEKLRQEPLENVALGTNELRGTIDITGNKVLCVTVPYENGWKAYVDGREREILRANYAFMGLKLSEGHHEIVFKYHVPCLTGGTIISFFSLAFTVGVLLMKRRKSRETNGEVSSSRCLYK